jgi:hypothetical protein
MHLPVKARLKLMAIQTSAESAHDASLSATRRLSDINRAMATAPSSERANLEFEISRWRGKQEETQRWYRSYADLVARLEGYILTLGPVQLADAKVKTVTIAKGETLAQAAARIRAKISGLKMERQKVLQAALPIADAKLQAAEYVAKLVERGAPKIVYGHTQDFRALFNAIVDGAYTSQQDIGAHLAWLDSAAFLQRLCEQIDAAAKPLFAIGAQARTERFAGLDAELLLCEFEDEAVVEKSEVDGPVLERRADADPRAILGLAVNRGVMKAAIVTAERVR